MFTWNGADGKFTDLQDWSGTPDPSAPTNYQINSGVVDFGGVGLIDAVVTAVGSAGAPTLTLDRTFIDATSRILTLGSPTQTNVMAADGTNWNFGDITLYLNPPGGHDPDPDQGSNIIDLGVDPARPGAAPNLVNVGTINSAYGSVNRIDGLTADAKVTNDGRIEAGKLTIDADVVGHGTISFFAPYPLFTAPPPSPLVVSSLELDRAVGAGQTIDMSNDATLVLADPGAFDATIKGFGGPTPVGTLTAQELDRLPRPRRDRAQLCRHRLRRDVDGRGRRRNGRDHPVRGRLHAGAVLGHA